MITQRIPQLHPESAKRYRLVWSERELGAGVTIDTASWSVPNGLIVDSTDIDVRTVSVFLRNNGSAVGSTFSIWVEVTTSDGETLNEGFQLEIGYSGH